MFSFFKNAKNDLAINTLSKNEIMSAFCLLAGYQVCRYDQDERFCTDEQVVEFWNATQDNGYFVGRCSNSEIMKFRKPTELMARDILSSNSATEIDAIFGEYLNVMGETLAQAKSGEISSEDAMNKLGFATDVLVKGMRPFALTYINDFEPYKESNP